MTENQRLKELETVLHFKTQKAFADRLGIKPGTYSDIVNSKNGIGVSSAIKTALVYKFNVNLGWFETGEGEQFNDGPSEEERGGGVPYYNANAENLNMAETKPEYFVNYLPLNDCTAYITVYGDSMYPRYAAGEVIAIKEIKNFKIIQWGEAYVVVTDTETNDLRSIKLIHEHPNKDKLILRSSNPNFKGDTVINRKNIVELYIIKGKITRNHL